MFGGVLGEDGGSQSSLSVDDFFNVRQKDFYLSVFGSFPLTSGLNNISWCWTSGTTAHLLLGAVGGLKVFLLVGSTGLILPGYRNHSEPRPRWTWTWLKTWFCFGLLQDPMFSWRSGLQFCVCAHFSRLFFAARPVSCWRTTAAEVLELEFGPIDPLLQSLVSVSLLQP